jgi:hypothetical protein
MKMTAANIYPFSFKFDPLSLLSSAFYDKVNRIKKIFPSLSRYHLREG